MKYFDDFYNVAEKLCAKKNSKKTNQPEPIEAFFQAFKIHACPGEPLRIKFRFADWEKNEVSKFPQNNILLWMPSIITTYGSKK